MGSCGINPFEHYNHKLQLIVCQIFERIEKNDVINIEPCVETNICRVSNDLS
jgi:hypothetical protein